MPKDSKKYMYSDLFVPLLIVLNKRIVIIVKKDEGRSYKFE